jgi:hypothetical protein
LPSFRAFLGHLAIDSVHAPDRYTYPGMGRMPRKADTPLCRYKAQWGTIDQGERRQIVDS